MEKLIAYKRMPLWNKQTMPEAVQQKHNTKVGTLGENYSLEGGT
ncbi:PF09313 domain protein [Streptococcus oralis SK304]|uniref:PF09313 domain protein n=1 Tax=Streptococcus oralis SK304 TaxID=1161421 RepID=J4K8M5_STROR|nr:PF09313 domain protein [Streptococcus oralis SK304]